jgi:hypothetical protein
LPFLPLLAFVTITLGYLLVFYPADDTRRAALPFIFAPDQLLVMWCGGKLEYFSLFDRWPIIATAGVILGSAWLAGRIALQWLGIAPILDRLERAAFATGVGLNLLSLYALTVGLAGGLQQRWLFLLPLVALVAGNLLLNRGSRIVPPAPVPIEQPPAADQSKLNDPRWYLWLLAALPFAAVIVFGGMLPPGAYDVREYHLQAPKEWFQNGRIDFLPHNIYANMPLGSELTSLWAMALIGGKDAWWWGAITGKTVMACYSLVTAAALLAFGRRVHSLAAGVIAALVFLSTPWIVSLAVVGYNEGPVAMYALLAIYALWLSRQPHNNSANNRLITLSGLCAGSAVACKYPPLLFLAVPLFLWISFHWCLDIARSLVIGHWSFAPRSTFDYRSTLRHAVLFLLAALAACGLWFAKNAVLTGNPTYPLLYSVFDGRTRTPEKDRQWTRVHSPQPDSNGNRFTLRSFANELAWIAWRTKWASACLLPLALMAAFAPRSRKLAGALALWMLFVFLSWWLLTHRLDRFLVLLLPAAALLAGIGAVALPQPAWRIATLSLIAWAAIAQFPLVTLPFAGDNRFFAPLAGLRRDDLQLGELAGLRVDFAHRWLNANVPPGKRVLLVGDAEPFDLEVPTLYNTCFDDCVFTRFFQGRTRAERLAALQQASVSHLFISWTHLARYRSPGNYGYTSDYITPALVHEELVGEQKLLQPIPIESMAADVGEIFAVSSD